MANFYRKGKYIEAKVRFRLNPKTGIVELSSNDRDLSAQGFHLTLDPNSVPSQIVVDLLRANGVVVDEDTEGPLPSFAPRPYSRLDNWRYFDMGLGVDGEIYWDLRSSPHLLITGGSGSGKTVAVQNILAQAVTEPHRFDVILVDPKKHVEYEEIIEQNPEGFTLGSTLEELDQALYKAHSAMFARLAMIQAGELEPGEQSSHLLVAVEVLSSYLDYSNNEEERRMQERIMWRLTAIAQKGRAVGVNLLLTDQFINKKFMTSTLLNNLTSRCVMGRVSTVQSVLALGSDIATKTHPVRGRGVMWNIDSEEPKLVQIYGDKSWQN